MIRIKPTLKPIEAPLVFGWVVLEKKNGGFFLHDTQMEVNPDDHTGTYDLEEHEGLYPEERRLIIEASLQGEVNRNVEKEKDTQTYLAFAAGANGWQKSIGNFLVSQIQFLRLKCWCFENGETEWVAHYTADLAREILREHNGGDLSDDELGEVEEETNMNYPWKADLSDADSAETTLGAVFATCDRPQYLGSTAY